jgi:hypothetical protein
MAEEPVRPRRNSHLLEACRFQINGFLTVGASPDRRSEQERTLICWDVERKTDLVSRFPTPVRPTVFGK